jgi:cell wall-associated NlpC family hydrolase
MIKQMKIADAAGMFLDVPYRLGAWGPTGYDCLSFVYCFFWEMGIELPKRFGRYTLANYAREFKRDPEGAKSAMEKWLSSLGEKVNPNFMQPGDLALFYGELCVLVYMGRGNFIGVHAPRGVTVAPRESLRSEVKEVRRICRRQCP